MSNLLFTEKYNNFSIETHPDRDTGTIDYVVAYCVNDASVRKEINVDLIKEKVSQYYNIKISDFNLKKRTREIAFPRQVAMYLSRELTDLSLPKIGESFGGKDHTTVMHAHEKISNDIKKNKDLKDKIENIINDIKNN